MSHPPMPRGLNFPPSGSNQDLPIPPQPTRADMRRSLFIELSNEMEVLERERDAHRAEMGIAFESAWDDLFGKNVFPHYRKQFRQRLGL